MSYIEQLYDLNGKLAVIIGGTSELCAQMGLGLAQAGVEVVLAGRNEEKGLAHVDMIEDAGGKAYFVGTDLMEKGSLYALQDIVLERSGKIDILINGAGVNNGKPVFETVTEDFQTVLDINLTATFQACQVFGQYFIEHNIPGSIINLGSIAGMTPITNSFAYSASKAAVNNLTKSLAREWADNDIRVNTITPGFFPSEEIQEALDEAHILEILRQTPMSRFGNPKELIGLTLLLSSSKASGYITGSEFVIDGGFNTMSI